MTNLRQSSGGPAGRVDGMSRQRPGSRDALFKLVIIGGDVARGAGSTPGANPHRPGSALSLCWNYGWHRRGTEDTVSRETKSVSRRVGRGRSVLGDRREWSRGDLKLLKTCLAAGMSSGLAGRVLGRSGQAVRTIVSRRKKARLRPRKAAA